MSSAHLKARPIFVFTLIVFIILISLGVTTESPAIFTIGTCVIWLLSFLYSVMDIKNRFTMFSFLVGFFVFLLGGYVIRFITTGTLNYFSNSGATILHTCRALLISLGCHSLFGIYFHDKNDLTEESEVNEGLQRNLPTFANQIIVILLIYSFACELVVEIATTTFLRATSYANSEFVVLNLPGIITYPASLYYISLFLYWATFPEKKKTIISIAGLLLVEFIILISGERGEPISLMFAIVFYLFLRARAGYNDITLKRRYYILLVLLIPVILIYLQTLSETRVNRVYDLKQGNVFVDFFESQGVSAKIIANGYDMKERISEIGGNTYILGEIRNYFKTNVLTRLITGSSYAKDKIALATSGDLYDNVYMYLFSPYSYLNGIGAGTTYVAESYHDGGYILLIIVSIGLAYLISYVDKYSSHSSLIGMAIRINIFRYMVLIPRGYVFMWLTNTFAVQNILLFVLIYFLINRKAT